MKGSNNIVYRAPGETSEGKESGSSGRAMLAYSLRVASELFPSRLRWVKNLLRLRLCPSGLDKSENGSGVSLVFPECSMPALKQIESDGSSELVGILPVNV